jgi:hypothetical protein
MLGCERAIPCAASETKQGTSRGHFLSTWFGVVFREGYLFSNLIAAAACKFDLVLRAAAAFL